jgi:xanthine dehydrogenase large subunit
MFVIESAIARAAEALGLPAADIQRRNLLSEGDPFPYGMRVERSQARRAFTELEARADLAGLRRSIETFNRDHALTTRGLALMPVCFGISFTSTFLNQASALVHVYTDGSVSVSTAAVEMGQGVNTKIAGIAARTIGLPAERIRIETTNTTRVANTSPTAASSGADMNGRATELACRAIFDRLLAVAAELLGVEAGRIRVAEGDVLVDGAPTELAWEQLVWTAYTRRVSLSAQAHYATPHIHYDRTAAKPFAYRVPARRSGSVDCLRGSPVDRSGGARRRHA